MTSAVCICPATLKDAANALAETMGWGPNNYTIPLGSDGVVTHYGCRADVTDGFAPLIQSALDGEMGTETQALVAAIVIDLSDTLWGREHFDAVCAVQGLAIVDAVE